MALSWISYNLSCILRPWPSSVNLRRAQSPFLHRAICNRRRLRLRSRVRELPKPLALPLLRSLRATSMSKVRSSREIVHFHRINTRSKFHPAKCSYWRITWTLPPLASKENWRTRSPRHTYTSARGLRYSGSRPSRWTSGNCLSAISQARGLIPVRQLPGSISRRCIRAKVTAALNHLWSNGPKLTMIYFIAKWVWNPLLRSKKASLTLRKPWKVRG